ncbi:MAG: MFS family permease [Verrucomicrobiales bacterium]|jgi:MFS family permease
MPAHPVTAVFLTFIVNGALLGTWVSRIPAIQAKLELSEAALGIVLLGLSLGVLVGLSLASGWVTRFGSRMVIIVSSSIMCIALPGLPLMPNVWMLWPLLFLFGGAMSIMDVAMNEQAIFVERQAKKPLMSRFHGAFSIGGLAGALLGAAFASAHIAPFLHFIVAVALFGSGMGLAARHLLRQTEVQVDAAPVFCIPSRALWPLGPLGAVALICSVGEGATADWSAVYLADTLGSEEGTAALAFAAYSLAMTIARFSGDHLKSHFSLVSIVRTGGWIAVAGLVLVVAANHAALTIAGFAIIGLGLANIIPIAFTAAGNYPGISSSTGIAAVASIGYAGFLASPPLIGLLAEATSLRIAFAALIGLLAILPLIAQAVAVSERGT